MDRPLKESKRETSRATNDYSVNGYPLMDGSFLGSQSGKENNILEHGSLTYLGQAEDNECSCFEPGVHNLGLVQDNHSAPLLERASCFASDGTTSNCRDHSLSGGMLCPRQSNMLGENAGSELFFSHMPGAASNHGAWRLEQMGHGLSYLEGINQSGDSEQTWHIAHYPAISFNGVYNQGAGHVVIDDRSTYAQRPSLSVERGTILEDVSSESNQTDLSLYAQSAAYDFGRRRSTDSNIEGPWDSNVEGLASNGPLGNGTLIPVLGKTVTKSSTSMASAPQERSPKSAENWMPNGLPEPAGVDGEQTRKDPLYTDAEPDDDGMYHCPFIEEQKCEHVPTKLKCNYDKYIDSHLKPHRCNRKQCQNLRFSSTACRLRHEREAHGSHGHGLRPYLCVYSDCDRSKEGNGFPRSWNCNDHMRRVHGHAGSTDGESQVSPMPTHDETPWTDPTAPTSTTSARKRAGKAKLHVDQGKRAKLSTRHDQADETMPQQNKKQSGTKLAQLEQDWRQQFSQVHQRIHGLRGPLDMDAIQALHDESASLLSLSKDITRLDQQRNGNRSRR